jgi:hypothetical protein
MAHIDDENQENGSHGHGDQDNNGDHGGGGKPKPIKVEINDKTVVLDEKVMTGMEIKQAAITQGLQIQPDFVLQLQRPNGEYDVIGGNQELHIRKGMDFTCIAPDDNS